MATQVPYKQIRALYDEETITVYQAYSAAIAVPAVREQKLSASPDFQYDRMTWIKPSWCWMMYRAGYSYKDDRQSHILALKMKHEHFQYLLSQARLSADTDNSSKPLVRVQWDPERSPKLGRLPHRSIQIGIGRALSQKWVEEWIVGIEDVTDVARELKSATDEGVAGKEELLKRGLLMNERGYVVADEEVRREPSSPQLYAFVTETLLMSPDNLSEIAISEPLFRPLKRRKYYRKRSDEDDVETTGDPESPVETTALPPTEPLQGNRIETDESAKLDIAEVLRLRKLRHRRNGIEFTVARPPGSGSGTPQPDADGDVEMTPEEVKKVVNRFAPQTGQVMDVNRHMMAYIDSEMARRREGNSITPQPEIDNGASSLAGGQQNTTVNAPLQRQPAALGKLHEIDLGPDSTRTNIERTVKMLENGERVEEEPTQGKVRLGKDGKPWRGRKRRTSEDIQRDKLVEEVLRESRLDIYDEVEPPTKPDDEQAADDRIAEQFRREFMDAISSRRRRAAPAVPKGGKKKDERPKGPKLGGSRSARAAMREQQEKAAGRK